MTTPSTQQQSFNDRLARISTDGSKVAPVVHVGSTTEPVRRRHNGEQVSVLPDWRENIKYPLSFVKAFLIGGFGVLLARYARFQFADGSLSEQTDASLIMDGVIATGIGFALKMAMKLDGEAYKTAQTVGVLAMITMMHNLVHITPTAFSYAFSDEWVDDVIEYTEPGTIYFRGTTFVLGGAKPKSAVEQKNLPTVRTF